MLIPVNAAGSGQRAAHQLSPHMSAHLQARSDCRRALEVHPRRLQSCAPGQQECHLCARSIFLCLAHSSLVLGASAANVAHGESVDHATSIHRLPCNRHSVHRANDFMLRAMLQIVASHFARMKCKLKFLLRDRLQVNSRLVPNRIILEANRLISHSAGLKSKRHLQRIGPEAYPQFCQGKRGGIE